ncbi:hybrid sensor histidine kinase/response regulator [Frigidibacter mobilis]|uniref:histidine kinase n=1 Tax=Frigidibacter mobilis TaxID=1335048 RepID=A0A159Z2N7_9RHOB|nr:ATP-binding protein [Frigidibacter mobilis]AMY68350.1 PAS/PAC sensor hybrid histidine kinase [Frigidibacter mobilis]
MGLLQKPGGMPIAQRGAVAPLLLALVILCGLSTLLLVAGRVEQNIERVHATQTDNTTWLISQIEVDMLKLHDATLQASLSPDRPEALVELRLRYDILFSRAEVIEANMAKVRWYADESMRASWRQLETRIRALAATIDLPDAALRAELPALIAEIGHQAEMTRTFSITALMLLVSDAAEKRASLQDLLLGFSLLAIILILLLLAVTSATIVLLRRLQLRAAQNERIKANLEKAIEGSLDAVMVADANGRIITCNSAAESVFGYSRAETLGADFGELIIPERDRRAHYNPLASVAQNLERAAILNGGRRILVARRKDGLEIPVEATVTSDQDAHGEVIFFGYFRDISERLRINDNLQRARDEALHNAEVKSRFLAVMSHEMRTPLNGLIAAIDIVMETTEVSDKQAHFLRIARSCSLSALEQINDVLELTRLDGCELHDECEAFDVIGLILEIVEQSRPMAERLNNSLQLALPVAGLPRIRGYRRLFAQVLSNLLGNAIKFTDGGVIVISAQVATPCEGEPILRVEVSDTGIGIPDEKVGRIFEDFETLDDGYSRVRQGTGLGLGIARRAVACMKGEIGVESRPGAGSTFWFTVPLLFPEEQGLQTQAQGVVGATAAQGATQGCRVLIAEDNPINREVLREMLEHCGHSVTEAIDGPEAVALAAGTAFDLVLMDISMPMMDGVEASVRIRQGGASANTPIVGLTAHAFPDEIARFRACGMEEVIVKPITLAKLQDVLSRSATAPVVQAMPDAILPSQTPIIDDRVVRDLLDLLKPGHHAAALAEFDGELAGLAEYLRNGGGDAADIARAAHRIGGAAAVLGAARAHALLGQLESEGAGDIPMLALALDECRMATLVAMHALTPAVPASAPTQR